MKYPLYRNTLCPKLWNINEDGVKLDDAVRKGLLKIAQDFVANLKKENNIHIKIHDIVIIGSITNYNWTDYSDIDLHVVTDYKDLDMTADDAQTLFDAIKVGWNNKHNITMKGHDVEIYVQDTAHVPTSASSYSVYKNDWIQEPVKESPTFNKELIKKKYKEYKKKITTLLSKHDETALKSLLDKLYKYRQSGLDSGGELSEENIVFKIIRAHGYLDKIKDSIAQIYDKKMSVNELEKIDDGISSPDGKSVTWMADEDEGEFGLVPTDDDDARKFFTVHGMKVYAAFRVMPKAVQAMKDAGDDDYMETALVNLRHAVKHPEHGAGSKSIVRNLVKISVERLFNSEVYDASKISVIIPFGSKSKLNYVVANEVKRYVPNAVVLEGFLKKDKWKNVQLSPVFWHQYKRAKSLKKDLSYFEYVIRDLESKKKNHGEEEFEIKKVGATNRMYYSMFYTVAEGYSIDLIKKIKGANVLLIDDTLEAGATLKDAYRAVSGFGPSDVLTYIFLFGRYATVPKAVKEIAMNNDGYEREIENAAKQILSYAIEFGIYPDINPYIEDISSRYKKDDDAVYSDIARIASKLSK